MLSHLKDSGYLLFCCSSTAIPESCSLLCIVQSGFVGVSSRCAMDPVNLNSSVLENGQGLVDSARLCQFLAQREEANAVGTSRRTENWQEG